MNKIFKSNHFFLAVVLLALFSCSSGSEKKNSDLDRWMRQSREVKVLSTTGMIHDLVKQVGGEHVESIVLIKEDLDPHSYQLVKGDDEKFLRADLIFYNGLGLEHGPSLQLHLEKNPKAIGLGDLLFQHHRSSILFYKGQVDPHIWMDLALFSKVVPYIVEALSQKDPEHADVFRENGSKLIFDMNQSSSDIRKDLQKIPDEKRYLVTSHDAFNYFAKAYLASSSETDQASWQKRFVAPEGLAPESSLSAADIQAALDHIKKYRIPVVFSESNVGKDSLRKLVSSGKEKGISVTIAEGYLYGDAMGPAGSKGDTYLKMIRHNADVLIKNLE